MEMIAGFDFAAVFDDVVARAGGEQSTVDDVVKVRAGLRLLLERWEAKGYNTWRIRTHNLTTFDGQSNVTLPECVDDVVVVTAIDGMGRRALRRKSEAEFFRANRGITGAPSSYCLSRQIPAPLLKLNPMGAAKLEVLFVERPEDFNRYDGSRGLADVPGRWLEALILGLAHDLARKRPLPGGQYDEGLIQRLRAEAAEAEDIAIRADRGRQNYTYRVAIR
jgi:hypothetical protein